MGMLLDLLMTGKPEITERLSEIERKNAISKKDRRETKRISVIVALERVLNFCNMHLNLPGTTQDRTMLEIGKLSAIKSLNFLQKNEDEEDVSLDQFLSIDGYYEYVIVNLEMIGITHVSDFIPYLRYSVEERAKLRRVWNVSYGKKYPPVFLHFLTPKNRGEIYGNYST